MINAAIIGLGWWGKTLVEAVSGVSEHIRFVAATTRSLSDDARAFAKEHNLELRESWEDIIADPTIDAVVLVTPNSMHSAQTIAAAQNGKHVFCEKPFALTHADAASAVAACEKAGVTIGVGYNRRFHPEITRLRERINSGELGTILHCEATMTFPNGLFLKPDAW
ncbi:MAG: Gfo/Idh/MocA family oxidoreductase, partial [Gammaproteobacteria bacterium]|nr:Gfo/Idh/MocA family oxidoreductase [Gammaproteobacteria bacterium]